MIASIYARALFVVAGGCLVARNSAWGMVPFTLSHSLGRDKTVTEYIVTASNNNNNTVCTRVVGASHLGTCPAPLSQCLGNALHYTALNSSILPQATLPSYDTSWSSTSCSCSFGSASPATKINKCQFGT